MIMTLQQIRYVITISETGSMNKAAELLYVSQPSLTESVKELEKELGVELFNRTGRGVTLTSDGTEFIAYARQLNDQYDAVLERFSKDIPRKKSFSVSTQHYSFIVKAFIDTVSGFNASEYEFAIRETKTRDVIEDVFTSRSEIGVIYLNDFNRQALAKVLREKQLEYKKIADCEICVYLWKDHPLAKKKSIRMDDLSDYPCISFEQGANSSLYYAEEALPTSDYSRLIKANDRATVLNLMVGMNGYTLCVGHICEELNGSDYVAVPLKSDDSSLLNVELVYITRRRSHLSHIGQAFVAEAIKYLN